MESMKYCLGMSLFGRQQLEDGDVITASYIVTEGQDGNGHSVDPSRYIFRSSY